MPTPLTLLLNDERKIPGLASWHFPCQIPEIWPFSKWIGMRKCCLGCCHSLSCVLLIWKVLAEKNIVNCLEFFETWLAYYKLLNCTWPKLSNFFRLLWKLFGIFLRVILHIRFIWAGNAVFVLVFESWWFWYWYIIYDRHFFVKLWHT